MQHPHSNNVAPMSNHYHHNILHCTFLPLLLRPVSSQSLQQGLVYRELVRLWNRPGLGPPPMDPDISPSPPGLLAHTVGHPVQQLPQTGQGDLW